MSAFNGTEAIGAGIAYLIVAVNSDVTVKSHCEIVTLTSATATDFCGAAVLKSRVKS